MLTIQLLPAGCGDCLWIEYGEPGETRVVIIDGGESRTITALKRRIAFACRERDTKTLDVELLVVTHIDNDHIEGVLELLGSPTPLVRPKDLWFNGRPQLIRLPPRDPGKSKKKRRAQTALSATDFLGGAEEEDIEADEAFESRVSPADLLGPAEGDRLSELITKLGLPWNHHATWHREAVVVPDEGAMPIAMLDGGLRLTLLGPTRDDLYKLSAAWSDVLGGTDEPSENVAMPDDFLGRGDTWPPVWSDKVTRDSSKANGSSIMLLAEYGSASLLLPGDGHAPSLADALIRLQQERGNGEARIPISAFKVSHHGSSKNVSREVIEHIECGHYLISTDGSKHRHPDHQTMLRILRYSKKSPRFFFNYESDTTTPWRDGKSGVIDGDFKDYKTTYPDQAEDGLILRVDCP